MIIHEISPQIAAFFTTPVQAAKELCSTVTLLFQKKRAELGQGPTVFTLLGKQVYQFSVSAARLMPFLLSQPATAGSCGTVSNPKFLYLQNNNRAFRVNFDAAGISSEDIEKAAASCGFSALNTTISGLFTAVESCVCFYSVSLGEGSATAEVSDLDLYQHHASAADTDCMRKAFVDQCCPNSPITILAICSGLFVITACCVCIYTFAVYKASHRRATPSHQYVAITI